MTTRRVLFLSENAPVPSDRRVWNEARTLRDDGWEVVVASAQGSARHTAPFELRDGIEIHRFPLRPAAGGPAGYAREYAQAMWRLTRMANRLGRSRSFDVVHACNPPDFLLLAALGLRRRGARLVFDHHDLVPELYLSKYGDAGAGHRAALALERVAFRLADVVISTNESYRRIAIERGGFDADRVFVVRNGPDLARFRPSEPDPAWRRGRARLLAYLGIMGPQDGLEHALRALGHLAAREDWHAVFVGEGDMLPAMRELATQLGIADRAEFAGWRFDDDIRTILSTADVCLAPDPPSPLNDVSTMIKIPEYLAMGRAVVSYDLPESRVSAGDAALYAEPGDIGDFARSIRQLLDDDQLRARMAQAARRRAGELAWERSAPVLLAAYERALMQRATAGVAVERAPVLVRS